MTDFISPVRCMVTIVDRGKGDRVVDLCRARHVAVQLVMLGHGTASAEVMDYLGLDEPEKDIVLSLVPGALVAPLLADLTLALGFSRPGKGIAFTVPLSGISAAANRQTDGGRVRAEINVEREVPPMTENNQFELIISVVEHGMADDVMAAAKTAGATRRHCGACARLEQRGSRKIPAHHHPAGKRRSAYPDGRCPKAVHHEGHLQRGVRPYGRTRHRVQRACQRCDRPGPGQAGRAGRIKARRIPAERRVFSFAPDK